ncbi:uncharacterized protein LAESUDRAFT_729931 [Laetiporus sulphureus 93-53]|uniref:Uncharacterized protein n=1 Tax=Laetiporus sulphureus 93-53 TaxID=1314785 RepID=A0A165CEW6_9APHY|nr:uncharacterized protein LAESUDRAFT_729931 [Laetiporus sulphureus 93-53]KZT02688.1 hypothetical protein LAESUDRAFT_729931 [Laetiporus sulphureus 93-53]
MQAYSTGSDAYYPQTTQYAQPQATYYAQYTQYHPYLPPQSQQTKAAPVYPGYAASYDSQAQFPTPAPPKRKLSRSIPAAPTAASVPSRSATPAQPRRSTKKQQHDRNPSSGGVVALARQFTSESKQRVNGLTRARSNSLARFRPDHLFVSFDSGNEIRMDDIAYQPTLDELREVLLPMWPPGISYEDSRGNKWRVRFLGKPWRSAGSDAILAQRIICSMYAVLARQGYSYLTTVRTNSRKPPRLLFVESSTDYDVRIFSTMFNASQMRLSLLDAPTDVASQLAQSLRAVFPRRISSYSADEDGVHIIEIKKERFGSRRADIDLFTACMLQSFSSIGFKLDGSVPFGLRTALGLGPRREAWIFRGTTRRSMDFTRKQPLPDGHS